MHYSRVMPPVNGQRYFTSTAVFMNEIIKLALSLTMALFELASREQFPQTATATALFGKLSRAVFSPDSWKLAVPALLYTLQNSLQYIAVSNLDAATFQVLYQLKILTTAIFSVLLLGRRLETRKWISCILLMAGVAVVSISSEPTDAPVLTMKDLKDGLSVNAPRSIWDLKALGNAAAGQLAKRSATYEGIDEDVGMHRPQLHTSIGLMAVFTACAISGLAGVYFEKLLKDSKAEAHGASVWIRNVQLSFYSIWPALFIGVLLKDGDDVYQHGFFAGYNWIVWAAIICQAAGGLLVALVVKYADNIAKIFATSLSIVLSFLASVIFFDFEITFLFLFGTGIVLAATYLYNQDPTSTLRSRPPPINVSQYEKESQPSYFDLEAVASGARTPIRGDALSTSRPSTPTLERHHRRTKSSEGLRMSRLGNA
ncbi:nucleotide-sugar transporter [Polychaeton citri CBS 116435]|uniref:Nucleotide-sugar transporter n=1 Tax=Polychaeton citri CBS 116435 TaxID=1314669 RepID=A0A9P4QCK6_9PEZI|nr:nucleotide-sugar transporter [Polychaeton citri CBS 116435]